MKVNRIILLQVLILCLFFLLINNDFITYCEAEITIPSIPETPVTQNITTTHSPVVPNPLPSLPIEYYIERASSIFNSICWYSAKTFLVGFGVGVAVQSVEWLYNIRVLGSKLLYYYTPLGRLDDISGKTASWLGFTNTQGVLKQVIDTVPYEEFWPLKIAKYYILPNAFQNKSTSTNSNISPINTSSLGPNVDTPIASSNLPENQLILRSVQQVPEIIYRDRIQVVEKQVIVKEYNDRPNLLRIKEELQELRATIIEKGLIKHELTDIPNVLSAELVAVSEAQGSSKLITLFYGGMSGLLIESKFQDGSTKKGVVSSFDESYPNLSNVFKAFFLEAGNYEKLVDVIELTFLYNTDLTLNPINCKMRICMKCDWVPVIQKGKELLLLTEPSLHPFELEQHDLVKSLELAVQNNLLGINTEEQETQTPLSSVEEIVSTYISSFLSVEETKESEITTTQTDFSSPLAVSALGAIGLLTSVPLHDLLNFIINSPNFELLINNPEALHCVIQLYQNNGLEIPDMLLNLKHSMLPDPNSYLLEGEELLETGSNKSYVSSANNNQFPTTSLNIWLGLGVATIAVGALYYLSIKIGIVPTDIPITEMTDLDEIRKSALNLKK